MVNNHCRKEKERDGRGRPPRTFANPLLAEAASLARERQLLAEPPAAQAAPEHSADQPAAAGKKVRSRWMDDEEEEEGTHPNAPAAGHNKRQRHSPIVWPGQDPSTKTARTEGGSRPISAGMTMAERAQAELEEFRRRQADLVGQDAQNKESDNDQDKTRLITLEEFMNASPDVSSPEEELHIRREGNSAHDLRLADEQEDDVEMQTLPAVGPQRRAPAPPGTDRGGYFDDLHDLEGEEEEEDIAPGPQPPPRIATEYGFENERIEPGDAYPEAEDVTSSEDGGRKREYTSEEEREEYNDRNKKEDSISEDDQRKELKERGDTTTTGGGVFVKRQVSMLNECRSVENYEKLNRISEGTYGVVYRARDRETGEICALKKVKLEKERDGFPLTSVREINVLLSLAHPSIVNVSEVCVGSSLDAVFMVMEYADHDLKGVMERRMNQAFTTAEVKCLMRQLLSGVAYLHANWVIHRDLKTSNILYTNRGQLKICDFGLARQYGEPLKPYTQLVVTLWYRAPELLLGAKTYSTAVDVWSCGCIMAELLAKAPLFAAQNEISQLDTIFRTLGTPTPETWPGVDQLPNFRKFNFKGSGRSLLRYNFPPPGPIFDGRPAVSEAGFDLLRGLLEMCPVREKKERSYLLILFIVPCCLLSLFI